LSKKSNLLVFHLLTTSFRGNLARPAATLFMHNLTEILESAIRATNAQYDDSDILKRLDVRLLEV
jgi:gamma-tubulin complex component 3